MNHPTPPTPTNTFHNVAAQVHQDPDTIPEHGPNAKKIIAYRGDRSACWFYRLHCPLAHIARNHIKDYRITVSGQLDTRQLNLFDLAIMQRQYKAEVFEPMLLMKKYGTKIIYEIDDDLFHVPKWNPAHSILGKRAVQDNIKHFLKHVDAVFVTNDYLVDVYKNYCEKIYVLPNSIDYGIMHTPPNNSDKKVVCWQGSATHDRDTSIIRKAVAKLVDDDDTFVKLWHIELGVPKAYKVPFVPFEAFYSMFSQLDACVGLAPIVAVPFNRGKSNLKFLEYSVQGIATVASDFGPYRETIEHEKTGLLVSDNREWYDAVRYLLDDDDVRNEMLANAQAFVKENYDIAENYKLWKAAIDEILPESRGENKDE
jgi:glycosyltransferase involved in cell wall biosynthesis